MEYLNERYFVQTFIRKDRRERLLYELTTPGKRYDGISRFCHQAKGLLDPAKIIMEGEDLDRHPEFDLSYGKTMKYAMFCRRLLILKGRS